MERQFPYNRPSMAVWRGQYLSEALFRDDTRLWQNTKNLAKPRHRAWAPYRYPRACLPVPPVDLKDPTHNPYEEKIKVKTNWYNKEEGDIYKWTNVEWGNRDRETWKDLVENLSIPNKGN